jgi:hypothetical protein
MIGAPEKTCGHVQARKFTWDTIRKFDAKLFYTPYGVCLMVGLPHHRSATLSYGSPEPMTVPRSPGWIPEATIVQRGLAIVACFGHRLQIVPTEHQHHVTAVWLLVIHHGCDVTTTTLAQRMCREIRRTDLQPSL